MLKNKESTNKDYAQHFKLTNTSFQLEGLQSIST